MRVIIENIPAELKARTQWVNWKYESRNDKPCKIPVTPNYDRAKSDDPSTWSSFDLVVERYLRDQEAGISGVAGLGYEFSGHDGFVGIDLDDVVDLATGTIKPWAATLIATAGTYCEISPSGSGCKLFGKGSLPGGRGVQTGLVDGSAIELYDRGRFFCVTGHLVPGAPSVLADVQQIIDQLVKRYFQPPAVTYRSRIPQTSGVDRIAKCRRYVQKMDPAISKQKGQKQLFKVCCRCFDLFGLSIDEAREVINEYSSRCVPPWSAREIQHKLEDAQRITMSEGTRV